MKVVIAGGSGFIGRHLTASLLGQGHDVVLLTRSPGSREEPVRGQEAFWDAQTLGPWTSHLEGAKALVNLAGTSLSSKMTEHNKREILDSRVQSTQVLGQAIARAARPPEVWINSSAMGFYGDRGDEELTENSLPGEGYLADVCKSWEAAFWQAETPETRKAALRTGFVLGSDGGGLPLMAKFTRAFLGGSLGSGKQWLSWIHIADLVALFEWCLTSEATGPYNGVAPHPVRNGEFAATLRSVLHRPWSPPAPAPILKALGSFMAPDPSLALISARVLPKKALDEGFRFKFNDVRAALADLCGPLTHA